MHFKKFFLAPIFFGLTIADGPAVSKLINQLLPQIKSLDASISSLTAANSPTVSKQINDKAHKLGADMVSAAAVLGTSKPISGISEIVFLVLPLRNTLNTVNDTVVHLLAKKEIVKASKEIDMWEQGLKDMKPGILALVKAVVTQVPPALLSQSPFPIPKPAQIDPILGDIMDQLIGIFKGTIKEFTIPKAAIELIPGLALPSCAAGAAPVKGSTRRAVRTFQG